MEITWYGHSCFLLKGKNLATVVTDPYDHQKVGYQPLRLKSNIVTISHDMPGHNFLSGVSGEPFIISGPGEYEIGNVFITGVATEPCLDGTSNTLYVYDFNGINIVHLGNINRVPAQSEVESLGPIHVALVPVGGGNSLNASKAVEVISLLEPNIIIPMHYSTTAGSSDLEPITRFLKEMGITEQETLRDLQINQTSNLPEETQVIILDYPSE